MIWRDDDISYMTDLAKFARVQDLFDKYKVKHTIAVIAQDIYQNPDLIAFIKSHDIDVQLHCYEHIDMTSDPELVSNLEMGAILIERWFGKRPTTLFPPWNKADESVKMVAELLG